ncbi:MAG: pseudouridine synthase [Xanthobacteraceae bacterium]|nr:pseudouridine synthase [Xanthobacteraceae bacterium]
MPRDNDKNNNRGRSPGGKPPRGGPDRRGGRFGDERPSRASAPRGERKFGDKKFGDRKPGEKRTYAAKPYAGKSEGFRKEGPRSDSPRPARFNRDDRPQRDDRPRFDRGEGRTFKPREDRAEGRSFRPREDRGERPARAPRKEFGPRDGEKRSFRPREDRGDRPFKPREDRAPRGERSDPRPSRAGGFGDKKFGEKRPYSTRGEGFRKDSPRSDSPRPARFNRDDRPQRDERPRFNRDDRGPARGPRKDFAHGADRGADKPWQSRAPRSDDARGFDKPRGERDSSDRPRFSRSREDRPDRNREGFARPRFERDRDDRAPRSRSDWQEHPRSERSRDDRPRRDNENDSKIFVKRPAFGGRGSYRDRDEDRRAPREVPKKEKTGERIAKLVARAGLCSRRDAEEWITQGRVAVNGRVINSPALDVTTRDVVTIDGEPLPERERTRLFLYHKPRGLMTTHDDPEGRPTVFDNLPEGLPRLISVGRLDFNTEGLLLLTNDGGLSRALEHPDTGWLRRYRVRAHGDVTQAQLDQLKNGIEVDGVKYGSIDATLERDQGSNVWVTFAIREGKNREVRNVMAHLGLEVNRLIRISYGPFQLGEIAEGQVEEIKSRVLREQLGEKIATMSGAVFDKPAREEATVQLGRDGTPLRPKSVNKKFKRALIEDRKGRTVVVQRSGSDEKRAQNEDEANGYGPPRRPKRGYHGKRDLTPRD